jgi:hypothetical protein
LRQISGRLLLSFLPRTLNQTLGEDAKDEETKKNEKGKEQTGRGKEKME